MCARRICIVVFFLHCVFGVPLNATAGDLARRQMYLKRILSLLPPEKPVRGWVSQLDVTWRDWLRRTGELPPDFDTMPSLPFLPDPLVLDEGRKNIPIRTAGQWRQKREWIKQQIKHWVTGTFPPPPDNLRAKILSEKMNGRITLRTVELRFGPDHKAKMTVELIIPPGDRPMPVLMSPGGGGAGWISLSQAVQRGYIGCFYAGCDNNDDTETYAQIWYPQYDFTRLMRRAWGAHRVVDYLYTLGFVDKDKIGLAGLSRDGKQSLMAAAFDERIKAVIVCSGGTGAENPYRYTSDKFDNETIIQITTNFPHWLHPRLRFFVGAEHKLPVDQNLMMALVAPRGLLISSSIFENQGCPWGIEQNYLSVRRAYQFLDAEDKVGLHLRRGYHRPAARDIEVYVDFFDYVFGRGKIPPPRQLFYNYSFAKWQELSGESINPLDYPAGAVDDLLIGPQGRDIKTIADWQKRKKNIQQRIRWGLGDEPPTVSPDCRGDYLSDVIVKPKLRESVGCRDVLMGTLYFPADADGEPAGDHLAVVIYLHEYAYPTGYARNINTILDEFLDKGFSVFLYDQIGFGTRIQEGTYFYRRFPHWSKLGRMVADVRWVVDALADLDFIDSRRIYTAGYSLGATVGLYAAALDERIAGVASVCGFTPMRLDTADKGTEGIRAYSHLHGLLPRLGFFVGSESRIPYDFHEILACIAPRPVLVVAPIWDRYATFDDVKQCMTQVDKVYQLFNAGDKLELYAPKDYNRFPPKMQKKAFEWVWKNFK